MSGPEEFPGRLLGGPVEQEVGVANETAACGCISDGASGIIVRACAKHQPAHLKAAAALACTAAHLDTAGRLLEETPRGTQSHAAGEHLRAAARDLINASKAIGLKS